METHFFSDTRVFERVVPSKGHVWRKGKTTRSIRSRFFCPTSIFYLAESISFYSSRSFPFSVLWTRLHPRIPYFLFFLRPCLCRLGHAREFNSILEPGRQMRLSRVESETLHLARFNSYIFFSFSFISFSEENTRDAVVNSSRFSRNRYFSAKNSLT